jgi:hypothetical protein
VPLFVVTVRFDALEKFGRAHFRLAEFGTARMRLPKRADALF